jgi:demethylmenaquinone methyltransferase/2-methoxy-6-polyprenyl-1,4-benzoquinol methylase
VRLRDALHSSDAKRPYVRQLFATIADRYDLITVLLSYGRDRVWKRRLIGLAGPLDGRRAADLACGTGDIARLLSASGARVTALDITPRMLAIARQKPSAAGMAPAYVLGDMSDLPFGDATFDVVTTGYGLRNVPDLTRAVTEIARVLRPGGIFLSLDFNRPQNAGIRFVYHTYLTLVGSGLGWILHGNADTYRYIPESIRHYPGADIVVNILQEHGFRGARWYPVLRGLMAIHEARRA